MLSHHYDNRVEISTNYQNYESDAVISYRSISQRHRFMSVYLALRHKFPHF